jgi:hypothetical protein
MGSGNLSGLTYVGGGANSYESKVYTDLSGGDVTRTKEKGIIYLIKVL